MSTLHLNCCTIVQASLLASYLTGLIMSGFHSRLMVGDHFSLKCIRCDMGHRSWQFDFLRTLLRRIRTSYRCNTIVRIGKGCHALPFLSMNNIIEGNCYRRINLANYSRSRLANSDRVTLANTLVSWVFFRFPTSTRGGPHYLRSTGEDLR